MRVLLLGATGTIGRAAAHALVERGHQVTLLLRQNPPKDGCRTLPEGADIHFGDPTNTDSILQNGIGGGNFGAIVSCLASRTGVAADAWAIDHRANLAALEAAQAAGIPHMVLLSAICVQKPLLAFQHAKLAAEAALMQSGLNWTIVRPTAFFKSLSGQVERVRRGRPYLIFGDGALTACKPISDADLGRYIADCLTEESRWNRILPIGGPGEAITPRQQGEHLFALLGKAPRFKSVPVRLLDTIIAALSAGGHVVPALARKAELARIGRYYATESMLVLNPLTGRYDADATPSTGTETLFDHYARLVRGDAIAERGDHAVF